MTEAEASAYLIDQVVRDSRRKAEIESPPEPTRRYHCTARDGYGVFIPQNGQYGPCRKCFKCMEYRSQHTAAALMHSAKSPEWVEVWFITLTWANVDRYSTERFKYGIKKLRRQHPGSTIKYFVSVENESSGERDFNPHEHAIVYTTAKFTRKQIRQAFAKLPRSDEYLGHVHADRFTRDPETKNYRSTAKKKPDRPGHVGAAFKYAAKYATKPSETEKNKKGYRTSPGFMKEYEEHRKQLVDNVLTEKALNGKPLSPIRDSVIRSDPVHRRTVTEPGLAYALEISKITAGSS